MHALSILAVLVLALVTSTVAPARGADELACGTSAVVDPQCTIIGIVYAGNPTLYFSGCPSNSYPSPDNPCQVNTAGSWFCECNDASTGPCRAKATVVGDGVIVGRSCKNMNCPVACTQNPVPAPPATGSTSFYLCEC